MARRPRRTTEDVKKLAEEAKVLVDGGMETEQATKQVGISSSVYHRHVSGYKKPKAGAPRKKPATVPKAQAAKLVAKVDAFREKGMNVTDALKKVGINKTFYWNRKKGDRMVRGSINASSLPPRPKRHGGARPPKPVDMEDVASIAGRISRIDKKLRGVDEMQHEREGLAKQLIILLKG